MNVIVAPSIVCLAVQMPSPCRCGSRLATIAADHVLKCECGARRGLPRNDGLCMKNTENAAMPISAMS